MERTTVLLLFGGESSEHDVSIASARNVYAAIDDTRFDVILGYIDHNGKWWQLDSFEGDISTHGASQMMPALGGASFVTMPNNRVIKPDVILPILHGKNGEDGSVQGLAQLLHIPIVGCDMTASSLCMDKVATKLILKASGISIVPFEVHHQGEELPDFSTLSMKFGLPMFVKPARAGSSVGVSKVFSEEEFATAITTAHKHDSTVLIEQGISGRELEVAVLGNPPHHETTTVGEIIPDGDFYSYEAKYAATSNSGLVIPAEINEAAIETIRSTAHKAYAVLGCRGLSRVDFFLAEDGTIYVNEINTLPGFTNISMYPKLWRHAGLTYSQLIERLLRLAIDSTIDSEKEEE